MFKEQRKTLQEITTLNSNRDINVMRYEREGIVFPMFRDVARAIQMTRQQHDVPRSHIDSKVKMPGEANVLCRRTARQQKERKTVMLAYCRQIAASSVSSDAREKLKWIAW